MAIDYWHDMSILVGGDELAGQGKNVTLTVDVAALDTTAVSTTGWTSCIGGNKTATVDLVLMADFEAGDDGQDLRAFTNLGVIDVPHSVCSPSADGSLAYLMRGIPLQHVPLEGDAGGLAMSRISGRASTGPLVRGNLLHPGSTSRTSSSTGTGRQLGVVPDTKRMYAALHVLEATGTNPTLDVILQSDDNSGFTTPTSRVTFTQRTTTGTHAWGSVAGGITDTWWRISFTIGGTNSPSFRFAVTAGVL